MAKGKKYFLEVVIRGKDALSAVVGKAARGVHAFGRQTAAMGKSLWNGTKEIAKFTAGLGVIGYGAAKAGGFLYDLAKNAADVGSTINDLRARTGLSVAMLQELQYATELGGLSLEEFGSAMDTVTKNVGQLVAGKGKLKGFLASVAGPEFARELKKASPEARLELVLGGLMQIEDEAKRAAYATAFFGESGAKMAVLANEGADGLAKMRKEARELGLVMSEEDVAAMDDVGDELGKLERSIDGVKRKFGVELGRAALPVLQEAVRWIRENREQIGRWAKDFGAGVVSAAAGIKDALSWIVDNAGLIAAGLSMALGPIGVAAAAIGGIIALLDRLDRMGEGDRERALYKGMEDVSKTKHMAAGVMGWIANSDTVKARQFELANEGAIATGAVIGLNNQFGGMEREIDDKRRAKALAQLAPFQFGQGRADPLKIQIDVSDPQGILKTPTVKDQPAGSQVAIRAPDVGKRKLKHLGP